LVASPLVTAGSPVEPEESEAEREAKRKNAEEVKAREESKTKFENLDPEQAANVAGEAFPELIEEPAGGPPKLPAGQSITGYVDAQAARVDLGGEHGLVESLAPMAIATSGGRWSPVDLSLRESSGAFEPANPVTNVRIPKRLGEGAQLSATGVSVTPVDPVDIEDMSQGGSEGVGDGATVFYANTLTDTDTVVKPSTWGFAIDTILRSVESPQQLAFQVGLPQGASLVQAKDGSGAVEVVKEGVAIAVVPVPAARDAAGTPVPVSMGVSGDTLTLTVDHRAGSYLYPVDVDPEFNTHEEKSIPSKQGWEFASPTGGFEKNDEGREGIGFEHSGAYADGQLGEVYYQTNGDSRIYEISADTQFGSTSYGEEKGYIEEEEEIYLEIAGSSRKRENRVTLAEPNVPVSHDVTLCAVSTTQCSSEDGSEHNLARLALILGGPNNAELAGVFMGSDKVFISQPKETHATINYNTSSAEVDGQPNVLYTKGWLTPDSGAFEVNIHDAGLGVAEAIFEFDNEGGWTKVVGEHSPDIKKYLGTSSCVEVQCGASQGEALSYTNLREDENKPNWWENLPNGEDRIRYSADDPMEHTWSSEHGETGEAVIKVAHTPPQDITLTGLPIKSEALQLGEAEGKVKVEATDGEESVASPGVGSIELYIDGRETGKPSGSCSVPTGPCTVSGEWSLNGAEIGYGSHILKVKATDNAGNVEIKEYHLDVYQASPVAMGPGSVNPESGDFALGATDVALSGGAGSLEVTRHYDSRNLKEGEEGPLGPQWSLSTGNLASLEVLPDGSVMVVGSEGLTHFSVKKEGGFEAPAGDSNLTLEAMKNAGGEVTEYVVKDQAKGTTTGFTLPIGAKLWMPTISNGPVATDTVTDSYTSVPSVNEFALPSKSLPEGIAAGPDGNLWFAAYGTNEIGKITPTGVTAEYSLPAGSEPLGITAGPDGDMWFTEFGRNKIGKITTLGVVTEYSLPSEHEATDITVGREGDLWFTEDIGNTIGKMTPSGTVTEYSVPEGSYPEGITPGPEGDMWFTDRVSAKIGKIVTVGAEAGKITEYALRAGRPEGIVAGPDGNLWFANDFSSTIGKITTSGAITEYDLPGGSYPTGIAAGLDGNLWFTDKATSKIGKITTSGAVTEYALPEGSSPQAIAPGPDGKLWFTDHFTNEVGTIDTSGVIVEPKLELAPHPYSSCPAGEPEKWGKGCRGLEFAYYNPPVEFGCSPPPPPGENESEWGAYKGRLTEVTFIAYNPSTKAMTKTVVAKYEYDKLGRLRAVWNPAISPALKMIYGYDAEGHVSAITPPGQQPWTFSYGTSGGDPSVGKLLKVTRAPAATKSWDGEAPKNTKAPKLSGSAVTGVTLGVSSGTWSNEPVSYSYQWDECSAEGECTAIPGATNANYTLVSGNVGHTVAAEVQATNGGGSITAWSALSAVVASSGTKTEGTAYGPGPGTTIEYNVPVWGAGAPDTTAKTEAEEKAERAKWGQKDDPSYAMAVFPPDEPQGWPASDYKRATITYLDNEARAVNVASPSGAITTKEYNEENQVTRSLGAAGRIAALKESCNSEKECKSAEVAELLDTKNAYNSEGQLTDTWGPQHTVKLVVGKEGKSEETLARNHVKYHYDEGAPEGEKYNLVTKTEDGAETASKEEFDKRTSTTSYGGQSNLGWKLREPTSATTNPGGLNLTTTTKYEEITNAEGKKEPTSNVEETQSPAASGEDKDVPPAFAAQFGKVGSEAGQLTEPKGVVIASNGDVYVLDSSNNRIDEFSSAGTFLQTFGWGVSNGKAELEVCKSSCKAGISGSGNGQLKSPYGLAIDSKGDLWVADTGNDRVQEFNSKDEYVTQFGKEGTAEDQFKEPKAIAVASNGDVYVADTLNNRVEELGEKGEFLAAFGFGVSNEKAEYEVCTSGCKAGISGSGNGQFNGPIGIAVASNGDVWVADRSNNRVEEFGEKHEYLSKFGSAGSGNGQFKEPKAVTLESSTGDLWVADTENNRLQKFSSSGMYIASVGIKGTGNGQFEEPWGMAITSTGTMYVADVKNNRVQRWVPTIAGNPGAHDTKTIYYTAKGEAEVAACREHPEWAELPCETEPVAQPGVSGLPELPVTKIIYNMWDQPEKTEEAFGSTVRTKKTVYEAMGRMLSSEETSSPANGKELPKVSYKYNTTNGLLEEQSTTVGETTKTITTKYNTLGQLETYTDADGNTATFEYEKEKDARLVKVSDAKGSQTYHYNETTGLMTELVDSGAGTFKAEYNVAGQMASETFPNAMTATYTRNQAGDTTGIEYVKTAHCEKACPEVWYSDTDVPSIHGETLKQKSTLAEEPSYAYDAAGRLTEAQEIPAGEGCKTRVYAYDEEGNRASETQREPAGEGKCATEGGSTEWHTYDTANSLADPGVTYEAFGNTTKLPASDAGGSELVSEYYVDSQVYKQEQNGEKIEYKLDPDDRVRETVSKGNTAATVITHYDGGGSAVAWTGEGSGETEKWTRNVPGIDGALDATEAGEGKTGKQAVLLLHDLQGDAVAEAADNETETKLLKKYNSTEFGVPNGKESPPKYAWLGAEGVAGELPSGVITQDGITYVPQTGRPLQTEGAPVPAIINTPTPFTRPDEAWIGITAGEGAATGLANLKQKEEERDKANQPPGVIPSGNPGWWCGGEYGPCPEEGGGGGEEGGGGGGGCSGGNACAASFNPHHHEGVVDYHEEGNGYAGCSVWASYGSEDGLSGISGEIEIYGHWHCQEAVTEFEMQIALLILNPENDKWEGIGESYTEEYFDVNGDGGVNNSADFACGPEHADYDAWIFGRQYDGSYNARWWSWGQEAEIRTSCHGGVSTPNQ
jgi:YD repeat-containing protein